MHDGYDINNTKNKKKKEQNNPLKRAAQKHTQIVCLLCGKTYIFGVWYSV